jgi:hypothetical protein
MADQEPRLAFFAFVSKDEDTVVRGGILVTDGRGKPLEFRCTSPVRPTSLQKLLYGKTLIPHIAIELMALPLMKALRERPVGLFVRDFSVVELRRKIDLPVIQLRRQGEALGATGDTAEKPLVVESPSGRYQAVVATPHWEFRADLDSVRDSLARTFATIDILEPFDRIMKALDEIEKQKAFEG